MAFGGRAGGRGSLFGSPGTGAAARTLMRQAIGGWRPPLGYGAAPYLPLVTRRGISLPGQGQQAYNRWMAQEPGWNFGGTAGLWPSGSGGVTQPAGWAVPMAPGVVVPQAEAGGWHTPMVTEQDAALRQAQDAALRQAQDATLRQAQGPGEGSTAPPGVDEYWWRQFQAEHGGQTPIEYYGRQGEGLAEAMGDLEWSQGFEEMYGRPPTDDDWRAWWFQKRGLLTPEDWDKRWREWLEKRVRQLENPPEPEPEPVEQRPPLWVPPNIAWR